MGLYTCHGLLAGRERGSSNGEVFRSKLIQVSMFVEAQSSAGLSMPAVQKYRSRVQASECHIGLGLTRDESPVCES